MRHNFDVEISHLKDEILVLGSMIEEATLRSVKALIERDIKTSLEVIENDKNINAKRFAIENAVIVLIATQQPMANDLRILASVLDVASELERIGDYAKGIGVISTRISELDKPMGDLMYMAKKCVDMLNRGLIAFVNQDEEAALSIPKEDDEVDAMYDQFYRVLMTYVLENPQCIEKVNYLLWAAHNLERFADRVTNICERTLFVVSGTNTEIDA